MLVCNDPGLHDDPGWHLHPAPTTTGSPWRLHGEPHGGKATGRGGEHEQTTESSRWCYSAFPFFIFLAKPISPWALISSLGCDTGPFGMDSEHSLSEHETLGKQCAHVHKAMTLKAHFFKHSQQWGNVNVPSQNRKWLLFFLPRFGRLSSFSCNKFEWTSYLFSTSSWLFYSTRARCHRPCARGKHCISSLKNWISLSL